MSLTDKCAVNDAAPSKRDQVLQAAARCFVEEGFHGSSMSRIAKAAQMSVGHIYHYFASKDEIIAAIVRDEEIKVTEKLEFFRSQTRETLVDAMMGKIDEGVCQNTDVFHSVLMLEILAEAARNPGIAKIVHELDKELRDGFVQVLRGTLGFDDAEARAEALFTIFSGLTIRIIRNPDIDREALIPMIETAIRSIVEP